MAAMAVTITTWVGASVAVASVSVAHAITRVRDAELDLRLERRALVAGEIDRAHLDVVRRAAHQQDPRLAQVRAVARGYERRDAERIFDVDTDERGLVIELAVYRERRDFRVRTRSGEHRYRDVLRHRRGCVVDRVGLGHAHVREEVIVRF